ncbi:MAG: entericidin A/B family lipoprotein [Verrucomicrobiota bacterium]
MKKTITILSCTILSVATLVALTSCNTTRGIGEDIQGAGNAISSGAEKVQSEM